MAITVLLVDDVVELRTVVRHALRIKGGFEVVAEAGDGSSAIAAAEEHQPDVVVLDLGLPDLAGHEVLGGLRRVARDTQVVVFTGTMTPDRFALMPAVEGFVRKDQNVDYLVNLLTDVTRRRHKAATIDLGPDLADAARARHFLAERCAEWGCDDLVDDARLVVTELVTNALVHAGGRCELRARFADGVLRVEVVDDSERAPDPLAATIDDEHGRGLLLISALCTAWGVEALAAGKVVWAELMAAAANDAEAL